MSFDLTKYVESIFGIGLQIILLVIAYLLASSIGKKIISNILHKAIQKQKISKARIITLDKLVLNVFSYVLIFIFIAMLFGIFGLSIGPLIASAGVLGLAVGFGAQGLVSDVVTGFFILLEKQIEVGEYITTVGYEGIVEEIGLRTTQIRSFDGTLHFIPNRQMEGISNHSRGTMQALVDINIHYETDINQTMTVLQSLCEQFQSDQRFVDGPNVIGVQELGTSEITLRIIGQTVNMEQWSAERDIRKAVKEAFDTHNLNHP